MSSTPLSLYQHGVSCILKFNLDVETQIRIHSVFTKFDSPCEVTHIMDHNLWYTLRSRMNCRLGEGVNLSLGETERRPEISEEGSQLNNFVPSDGLEFLCWDSGSKELQMRVNNTIKFSEISKK